VCFDAFNKSTRAPSECPYCHIKICRTCLQTYLLNDISDIPRCVNTECGNGWERDFLDGEFTRSFRLTTYKDHRETVLKDRERARLPATQEDAAAYRNAVILVDTTSSELKRIYAEIAKLTAKQHELEARKWRAKQVQDTFGRTRMREDGQIEHVPAAAKKEHAAFVKPCPAPTCKGFLSTAWKCGLCELWTCPDCHELKGVARDDPGHTCDPDKVATVRLLSRDSRGCPKCGVTITKLEGCDQMFCTACNTGFSWRTGKIADGPIHNPHYFAWLRTHGGEAAAAAAPAVGGVGNCDANLDQAVARALVPANPHALNNRYYYGRTRGLSPDRDTNFLIEAWRLMREGQDLNAREPDLTEKFRELRVRFMTGDLDEADWKTALQRAEKDVNFARAVREVRDVYVGAVRDLIRAVTTPDHNKVEIVRQVQELVDYCNNAYAEVSKRFGRKTPRIVVNLPTP
jgi:hypothetical protein